jgi:hypothetical protein
MNSPQSKRAAHRKIFAVERHEGNQIATLRSYAKAERQRAVDLCQADPRRGLVQPSLRRTLYKIVPLLSVNLGKGTIVYGFTAAAEVVALTGTSSLDIDEFRISRP